MMNSSGARVLPVLPWIAYLLCSVGAFAQRPASANEDLAPGVLHGHVVTRAEPAHSYALYLPSGYEREKDRRWPLLFLYSPSGNGAGAARQYQAAAERFGWILMGSNNARNNDKGIVEAGRIIWEEAHAKYRIDGDRLYASGLSGGAAFAAMFSHDDGRELTGVFMHARGPASEIPAAGRKTFFLLQPGITDFNLGESVRFTSTAEARGVSAFLEVHPQGHTWGTPKLRLGNLRFAELVVGFLAGDTSAEFRKLVEEEREVREGQMAGPFGLLARRRLQWLSEHVKKPAGVVRSLQRALDEDEDWWESEEAAWKSLVSKCMFDAAVGQRYPSIESVKSVATERRTLARTAPGTTAATLALCMDLTASASLGRAQGLDADLKAAIDDYLEGVKDNRPDFAEETDVHLRKRRPVGAAGTLIMAHRLGQLKGTQQSRRVSTLAKDPMLAEWLMPVKRRGSR